MILMDADYEHGGRDGSRIPVVTGIVLHDVVVQGGGKVTLNGFDANHRLQMTFDDLQFANPVPTVHAEHADFVLGPGPVNFQIEGEDVRVEGKPGQGSPNACAEKLVPMIDK